MTKQSLYYLGNARSPEQREEMINLEAAGICIFCPEHLGQPGGKQVLMSNDHWSFVPNEYPYPGTKNHYMLVPREHVEEITQLALESWIGLHDLLTKVRKEYPLEYYLLASRNGNPEHTGATIRHLHFQVAVSDPDSPDPVVVYGSSKKQ